MCSRYVYIVDLSSCLKWSHLVSSSSNITSFDSKKWILHWITYFIISNHCMLALHLPKLLPLTMNRWLCFRPWLWYFSCHTDRLIASKFIFILLLTISHLRLIVLYHIMEHISLRVLNLWKYSLPMDWNSNMLQIY